MTKELIRKIVSVRFYSAKQKRIDAKLDYLRQNRMYEAFPDSSHRPTIYDYPFHRKSDKKYLDFFYSVTRKADVDYIPLTTYFVIIEPLLNQFRYLAGIADKNYYDLHFTCVNTPKTYLRKINRAYYDRDYQRIEISGLKIRELLEGVPKVIIKPSVESGAGKSIELFSSEPDGFRNNDKVLDQEFLDNYPDFVLQECVEQHSYFRRFNPDSNNTIRILTYRSVNDDQIHILHRLLRVGKKGNFLDHDNYGGIAIGISSDAALKGCGFDSAGSKFTAFNGVEFEEGSSVPFLDEIEEIAGSIASSIYYGRFLAFDFTVNQSGAPLLVEINCWRNGVSQYQMNHGSLFQEYTREVLDYCLKNQDEHRFKA